ncbi:MAG: NUDIX domain-containing protein [Acidobacteriia bacterium]|nr:NUDIX domain-containing protein [Terriglobia bacterium]
MRGCEQVAAVCYRVTARGIEFLLVQTRGGRWTFPKGGTEPGLTHAQAAALEAFEEAGVHGRMEQAAFARYIRRERGQARRTGARAGGRSGPDNLAVHAHLCEVLRLGPPQERRRNRTWFSAEKAKHRLQKDRTPDDGAELVRVVDRAVTRIQQLCSATTQTNELLHNNGSQPDALQKVPFEAFEAARVHGHLEQAAFLRYIRLRSDHAPGDTAGVAHVVGRAITRMPQLSGGSSATVHRPEKVPVIEIDQRRGTTGGAKTPGNGTPSK